MDHTPNQYGMQDPIKQYPQPKFEDQPLSAPGLAKDMKPKPDHGETSYKGSGRLNGRKALITGGDSGIGRAAAIAYAREGADVAISYVASPDKAEAVVTELKAKGVKARAYKADQASAKDVTKLVNDVAPRYVERNGGYLRILKLGPRQGDKAQMARIELV